MKRLVVVLGILALLVVPAVANAHPLGNFTTNQYAEVVASGDRLYVVAVLDLAEIPTFQAREDRARLGRSGYGDFLVATVHRGLELRADGSLRQLTELRRRLVFPAGAASLRTTRLEIVFDGGVLRPDEAVAVELENRAFAGRIGWKEIVVRAERGAEVTHSAVPSASTSDRLRAYPMNQLESPLDVTSASVQLEGADVRGAGPRLSPEPAGAPAGDGHVGEGGFASLIERDDLSIGVVLVALLLALFWGAAHALTPGHGKALVAAYLVGTRGTPRHAFMLGGTVTIAHTAGVFAIGIVTLALSQFILPEQLYPWLTLASGLLVVAVGAAVLRQRVRSSRRAHHSHDHRGDHHHHGHGDHHDHHHEDGLTSKGILGVGIAAGLLPCPSALVVLLSAIALHRVGLGLALIVAFSLGLAATITGIGLVAVYARRAFARFSLDGPIVRTLPAVSAALILLVGVVITARALPGVV